VSKRMWLGPVLGTARDRLIGICLQRLRSSAEVVGSLPAEHGFVYIAASRPLLDRVTDRLLEGSPSSGIWGTPPVYLFGGFVRKVLAEAVHEKTATPLPLLRPIDREEFPIKRSLISRIMKKLVEAGEIRRLAEVSRLDGCINSVCAVIGEIQRAGLDSAGLQSVLDARAPGFRLSAGPLFESGPVSQVDIDREIWALYRAYEEALTRFELTEDDNDQLRAAGVLKGKLGRAAVRVPWLDRVRLLIVDGFFDFTPIQGEMLSALIPRVRDVIVNFNWDEGNREIFRPSQETIERICSMAHFDVEVFGEAHHAAGPLGQLRGRLFKPYQDEPQRPVSPVETHSETPSADERQDSQSGDALPAQTRSVSREGHSRSEAGREPGENSLTLFECDDQQAEIRAIAKEIKRLVIQHGYAPTEICVVVRELTSYAETIIRIFDQESIPCALQRRVKLADILSVRAAIKLLQVIGVERRQPGPDLTIAEIADVMKTGYFRLSNEEIIKLRERYRSDLGLETRTDPGMSIAQWRPDEIENVIAYVGGELGVSAWLARARRIAESLAQPSFAQSNPVDETAPPVVPGKTKLVEDEVAELVSKDIEPESIFPPESGTLEARARPSTTIHPRTILWAALIVERMAELIASMPARGEPGELRRRIQGLFSSLGFSRQIRRGLNMPATPDGLDQMALDLRGMQGVRRAMLSAVESIEIGDQFTKKPRDGARDVELVTASELVEETLRAIRAQVPAVSGSCAAGIRVLEATEIRGLRFRAIFSAGLVEGGFPLRPSRDWIYPQEQREQLKAFGLSLEDISPASLLKEEHYFYQVACRATERLYLSRPLVSGTGLPSIMERSYYIEELGKAISPAKIETRIVHRDYGGAKSFDCSTRSEVAILLARAVASESGSAGPVAAEQLRANIPRPGSSENAAAENGHLENGGFANQYLSESGIMRVEIERERNGRAFGEFDGRIENAGLLQLLRRYFGPTHVFSASGLSMYGKCPFKFFAARLLGLEPRSEAALDLRAMDAGQLLHEIMRIFMQRQRGLGVRPSDRARLQFELIETADWVFDRYEELVPPLNPHVWKIDREIRKLLLEQVLEYELELNGRLHGDGFTPKMFELAFGMKSQGDDRRSTEKYLELERVDGLGQETEKALLRGRIDRVDLAKDGTVLAYDYKLSKGASLEDMHAGRDVQIGVYLAALEKLFFPEGSLAGGGYYAFKGGSDRRNNGLYRSRFSKLTLISGQARSNLDDAEWQKLREEIASHVWDFIDGMREGEFVVMPSEGKKTCGMCDYGAVCRYDGYRIKRKLHSGIDNS
jgi:ATP-dependent helicase/DNAse subunit B